MTDCCYPFRITVEEMHCESKVSCQRIQHNDPGWARTRTILEPESNAPFGRRKTNTLFIFFIDHGRQCILDTDNKVNSKPLLTYSSSNFFIEENASADKFAIAFEDKSLCNQNSLTYCKFIVLKPNEVYFVSSLCLIFS